MIKDTRREDLNAIIPMFLDQAKIPCIQVNSIKPIVYSILIILIITPSKLDTIKDHFHIFKRINQRKSRFKFRQDKKFIPFPLHLVTTYFVMDSFNHVKVTNKRLRGLRKVRREPIPKKGSLYVIIRNIDIADLNHFVLRIKSRPQRSMTRRHPMAGHYISSLLPNQSRKTTFTSNMTSRKKNSFIPLEFKDTKGMKSNDFNILKTNNVLTSKFIAPFFHNIFFVKHLKASNIPSVNV